MDVQKYIYSGVLEEYILGMLKPEQEAVVEEMSLIYPEVKRELESIRTAFEYFAPDSSIGLLPRVRNNIIDAIEHTFSDNAIDIKNLPEIKKTSNVDAWFSCIEPLIPLILEDFSMQVLRSDDKITQMLVVSRIDVPEESHSDVQETLLILKGVCECTIGGEIIQLQAGDYLEIPLHLQHDVKILTPYVVAIVQHKAVA